MAYLRSIKRECSASGCTATATDALLSNQNAEMGNYCRRHGRAAERRLQDAEDRRYAQIAERIKKEPCGDDST